MKTSIYQYTKDKLLTHGIHNTADGKLCLNDKKLFLKFVNLERAVRLNDFDNVQNAVQNIRKYAENIGRPHLVYFAYMYLKFLFGSKQHIDQHLANGCFRRTVDYQKEVTPTEILISEWASLWYERFAPSYVRVLYVNK